MSKAYVVTRQFSYEDHCVVAVFSSEEKAYEYLSKLPPYDAKAHDVEEHDLDIVYRDPYATR